MGSKKDYGKTIRDMFPGVRGARRYTFNKADTRVFQGIPRVYHLRDLVGRAIIFIKVTWLNADPEFKAFRLENQGSPKFAVILCRDVVTKVAFSVSTGAIGVCSELRTHELLDELPFQAAVEVAESNGMESYQLTPAVEPA